MQVFMRGLRAMRRGGGEAMSDPAPSPAERCASGLERAIREKETHSWCGHKACDLLWTEANEAVREIAALRAALKKAEHKVKLVIE